MAVESKSVEDVVMNYDYKIIPGVTTTRAIDTRYFIKGFSNTYGDGVFERLNVGGNTAYTSSMNFDNDTENWARIADFKESTHSAINLDSSSQVATKALVTQTVNATQMFTQEILPGGDTGQFDQLTSGTTTDWNEDSIQTKVLMKASSVKIGDK